MRRAVEELEDLATLVIDAKEPWRAVETHLFEMDQQCLDDDVAGATRAANGVADSDHGSSVLRPAVEHVLFALAVHGISRSRRRHAWSSSS